MTLEILTISADDYAKSKGKNLTDYEFKSLESEGDSKDYAKEEIIRKAEKEGCESIVALSYVPRTRPNGPWGLSCSTSYMVCGTGLKLKN